MKNNDIKLDLEDYKTILAHNGKIEGLVGVCKIDELTEQFNEDFKNLITKAKGLLVHFSLNKNQPISTINEYMVQLNMLLNKNTEVILGIENIDIDENMLKYKIIISGL